jgi:hypothetical protein
MSSLKYCTGISIVDKTAVNKNADNCTMAWGNRVTAAASGGNLLCFERLLTK